MSLLKFTRKKRIVPISATTDIVVVDRNGYIGEKRPNGNTVYFGYLDSWADYSQAGLGQVTIIPIVIGKVTIGGREYKTTKIGNQEWLAENLDFKFSGCNIGGSGTPSTPNAWYYNNNETTYGWEGKKYGLLYNWHAVKLLNDNRSELCPGWHVLSTTEWDALANAVGGSSNAGTVLKSTTDWTSGAGADVYGFTALPAGAYSGSFLDASSYSYFWTATKYSSSLAYYMYLGTGASMSSDYVDKYYGYSVRLVKDAT